MIAQIREAVVLFHGSCRSKKERDRMEEKFLGAHSHVMQGGPVQDVRGSG